MSHYEISSIPFQLQLIIYRLKDTCSIIIKSFRREDAGTIAFQYLASISMISLRLWHSFHAQNVFNICVTVLFLRLRIQYSLISQTPIGPQKQLNAFFAGRTKYNLKINHKKCKVMVSSSRKCKSSWYAQGVRFNVVKYFMWLCIIFHLNLPCEKQRNENLSNNSGFDLGRNELMPIFMIYQPKAGFQILCCSEMQNIHYSEHIKIAFGK